jgi:hypothetical protein
MNLYGDCYRELHRRVRNIVCACCSCFDHDPALFQVIPTNYPSLSRLVVDPDLVPFDFSCGVATLDREHVMIDPLGVKRSPDGDGGHNLSLYVCRSCHYHLQTNRFPRLSLCQRSFHGPRKGRIS